SPPIQRLARSPSSSVRPSPCRRGPGPRAQRCARLLPRSTSSRGAELLSCLFVWLAGSLFPFRAVPCTLHPVPLRPSRSAFATGSHELRLRGAPPLEFPTGLVVSAGLNGGGGH
uniref:Uncharacterized protein n=1 Tax=Aegilops tauschii subsp. strangulata TaxID=200361 RepID=A0A453JHN0_AEGTS